MVSTDGHRLAFEEQVVGSLGLAKGVILPRKGLSELKKLLDSGENGVILSPCTRAALTAAVRPGRNG